MPAPLTDVDHIERDPRGGLLSRIYLYILAGIYERPLSKTLFVIDRDALNRIMRHSHSFRYVPQVGIRGEMIERLQEAGMVRRDIDASMISSVLSVTSVFNIRIRARVLRLGHEPDDLQPLELRRLTVARAGRVHRAR